MDPSSFSRGRFLALGAALQAAAGMPLAALAQPAPPPAIPGLPEKLRKSLVLSGGGALGAYGAGVVQTFVEQAGVREGQPLPQYGVITGTSIGALNGYLVATAQWGKLSDIWRRISAENVIRLKPQFAKITDSSSGVLNRIWQAIGLAVGSGHDVKGVLDGEHLRSFLSGYVDPKRPVVTAFVWPATNLSSQLPEYFYMLPDHFDANRRELALRSMQLSVGRNIVLREASPDRLVDELQASAAVPAAFDPIRLPDANGKPAQYVDGGLTANTPITVARALSSQVDAVLLSPPFTAQRYDNIMEVTLGSFGTMQRVLMIEAIRLAFLETTILQAIRSLPPSVVDDAATKQGFSPGELRAYAKLLADTTFFYVQPQKPLPATLFGFDDAQAIADTYETGKKDSAAGFTQFNYGAS